jgi:mercuric ion transport protein
MIDTLGLIDELAKPNKSSIQKFPSLPLTCTEVQVLLYIGDLKMNKTSSQISKKGMLAALTGTVLVALCCFTPILVVFLGVVGLSAFTPYLDVVLLPALVVMIVVTIASYLRWRKSVANNQLPKD